MLNRNRVLGALLVAILVLAAAPTVFAAFAADVFAIDQPVVDNTVNVTRASINEAGWVVIHADNDGEPGPILGSAPLPSGISANVKVEIDPAGVTDVLYAMLHEDKGEAGTFEYPDGPDVPVTRNDKVVMSAFKATGQESTVVKVLADDPEFAPLAAAIDAAGLADTLRKEKAVTLFAPSAAAFAALGEDKLDALLADPAALSDVLLYHVVPDVVASADITDGDVETAQGSPLTLAVADGKVTVNGSTVITPDLAAYNGVIHVIDAVLTPPPPAPTEAPTEEVTATAETTATLPATVPATIVEAATAAGSFNTLLTAVKAAGLDTALAGEGPFTVFAPTDDAFAALPADQLNALLKDSKALAEVLKYHVLASALPAADINDGMEAATLNGAPLTFSLQDGSVLVNDAKVVTPDINTGNGIVHVIDKVLLPPATTTESTTTESTTTRARLLSPRLSA